MSSGWELVWQLGQPPLLLAALGWALVICGFWALCWHLAALLGGDR